MAWQQRSRVCRCALCGRFWRENVLSLHFSHKGKLGEVGEKERERERERWRGGCARTGNSILRNDFERRGVVPLAALPPSVDMALTHKTFRLEPSLFP